MGQLDGLFIRNGGSGGPSVSVTISASGLLSDPLLAGAGAVVAQQSSAHLLTGRRRFPNMPGTQQLVNPGPYDLTLAHADPSVDAADRFVCPNGSAYVLKAGSSVVMVDDGAANRTRVSLQDAQTALAAGQATATGNITVAQAIAIGAWTVGNVYHTNGRFTAHDGGAVELTAVAGTRAVDDVLTYASSGGVSLVRLQSGKPITALSCGLRLNGTTDDTAALQNALDVIGSLEHGTFRFLPDGAIGTVTCRITNTIYVRSAVGGLRVVAGAGCAVGNSNVNVLWQGPSDRPAFTVSTFGATFEGFAVVVSTGYTLAQAFDLTNAIHLCSRCKFLNLRVYTLGTGTLISGWTTNHYRLNPRSGGVAGLDYASGVYNANCEDMLFEGVCIAGWTHSAFRQSDSQPYNWTWHACKFEQNGVATTMARGVVHWIDSASASGNADSCFYYNIELAIYGGSEAFKITNPSAELVKKWYYSPYTAYASDIYLDIGRAAADGHGNTSTGPIGFMASDADYILAGGQAAITLAGFQTRLGGSSPGRINLSYAASLSAHGCIFPNSDWIKKAPDPQDGTVRGGVYAHGCKAMIAGGQAVELGEYRGALSSSMSVQLDNFAATTVTIPLERAETDTRYTVNVGLKVVSGTYTGRVERVSAVTTAQFAVELSAAPSSASIVLTCDISYPPSARQKRAIQGASGFSETTVLRGVSGTGPSVSANFALEFLVAAKTSAASLANSNEDNCCIASRGYSYTAGGWTFEFAWVGGLTHRWQFIVGNNTSASLVSPDYSDAELNKAQHFVVRGTGGVLTLFRQGLPIATLTTAVVQSAGEFCVGNRLSNPTLLEDKHVLVYAVSALTTAPSDAEIAARYEAVKSLESIPASWSGHTQTHRYLPDGRSTITNDVAGGADPLTLRLVSDGTLTTVNGPSIAATVASFY